MVATGVLARADALSRTDNSLHHRVSWRPARSYQPGVTDIGWRAPQVVRTHKLPRFYLVNESGCDFGDVRTAIHKLSAGRQLQDVLPYLYAQHLVDVPLVDALSHHPQRSSSWSSAEWHIIAATPLASEVIQHLGLLNGVQGHTARMNGLVHCLSQIRQRQRTSRTELKLLLLLPGDALWNSLPHSLLHMLLSMHKETRRVGGSLSKAYTVVLGVQDRSFVRIQKQLMRPWATLFNQSVVLPYIATPLLAQHAHTCASTRGAHAQYKEATTLRCHNARSGFMFHGSNTRFDFGARAASIHMSQFLNASMSLQAHNLGDSTLATNGSAINGTTLPTLSMDGSGIESPAHAKEQQVNTASATAMTTTSICFVPGGDTVTSRRLFDALAAGCVPVLVNSFGNGSPPPLPPTLLPLARAPCMCTSRHIIRATSAAGCRAQAPKSICWGTNHSITPSTGGRSRSRSTRKARSAKS